MSESSGGAAFRWLLGWGVILVVLGVANKTRFGHVILYYSLLLLLVFLLVTQYKWIARTVGYAGSTTPA